ncbi:MAG: hypothetical protein ABIO16_17955, partial [Nocardioides sp.]
MSESRLRAFADEAVRLVDVPDLAALERRGRDLRTRRRTSVVASLAIVGLLGTWMVRDQWPSDEGPDKVDTPARVVLPYPGNQMQDLPPGTYDLEPSALRDDPTALVTLPQGWNSWKGPNKFDGHRAGDPTKGPYNEDALGRLTWYMGVLVVKVVGVGRDLCMQAPMSTTFVETAAETVEAIRAVPGYRVAEGPEAVETAGYPATRLVLTAT